ncbi:MAG: sterol desaturase family protein, partial [Planctomycetota bacterium]
MTMIVAYFCIALLAMSSELLWPARKKAFFRRGLITDGFYVVINIGLRIVFMSTVAVAFTRFGSEYAPEWMPIAVLSDQPLWLQTIAVILILDFFFYWMHRAKHRWDWWYRLHETHHSSQDLDWFSSVRFHPFEKILDRAIYLFPLTCIGVSEQALLNLAIVDAAVASFSHANIKLRLGPLKYLVVGPEMHRWHHTPTADGQLSNFGNNLSIFDWIFGSARIHEDWPEAFGVDEPNYPEGNILKQFVFAFRSFPEEEEEPLPDPAQSSS